MALGVRAPLLNRGPTRTIGAMLTRLIALPALVVALSSLAGCSGDDNGDVATDPNASAPTTVTCDYPDAEPPAKAAAKPAAEAPKSGEVQVTIKTNSGDISATLVRDATPCTVNSFVSLAEQGYFDDTTCHRLIPGFVLQCGDPSASGSGGPGYSFADELSGSETYPRGVLAMANAGPDTNGSQFFIVLADAALPASYNVFGTVGDAGMAVADAIAAKGVVGESPTETVTIESVTTD